MKTSPAMQMIRKQQLRTLAEVTKFFQQKDRDMSHFETTFLTRMAKDGHLTSKELGIDTVVGYRKLLLKRQMGVTAPSE